MSKLSPHKWSYKARLISDLVRDKTSRCSDFDYLPALGTQRKWTYTVGEQEVGDVVVVTVAGTVTGVNWTRGRSLDAEYAHAD